MNIKPIVLSILLFAGAAQANEAGVKEALQKKIPTPIVSVHKTPYAGLYEVDFEDQIAYTDEKANYLFSGSIYDLRSKQNLTDARAKKLFAVKFDSLPLNLAFKEVKGSGKRRLAVFADPNCTFCKKLEKEMVGLTDVTIYRFPIAILQGSEEKARAVWCSADKTKAWTELLLHDVAPKAEKSCDLSGLAEVAKLAQKNRINGTPALIFEDGTMNPGYMPLAQLDKQLTASTPK